LNQGGKIHIASLNGPLRPALFLLAVLLVIGLAFLFVFRRRAWPAALADRLRFTLARGNPIDDVSQEHCYPCLRSLGDLPCEPAAAPLLEALARDGEVRLASGTYEFDLESFCMAGNRHGPGPGSSYRIAPLRGRLSGTIRRLLRAAATRPDVARQDLQALLWGITGRAGYHDWSPDVQRAAEQLLNERDLFILGKSYWRFVPAPVRQAVSLSLQRVLDRAPGWREFREASARWRRVLSDARATYEDLERAFLCPGPAPGSQDGAVPAAGWSLVPGGCFVRLIPRSYQRTRVQVCVPEPAGVVVSRDARGRIVCLEADDRSRTELEYDDSPEAGTLDLGGGRTLPVWRFRRVRLTAAPGPRDGEESLPELTIEGHGWVARDPRQLADLDSEAHPDLRGRIEAARALVHDAAQLRRILGRPSAPWAVGASGDREGTEGGPDVRDPVADITDPEHYREGLEAVLEDMTHPPSSREKTGWLLDHFDRLRRAYEYAASRLDELGGGFRGGGGAHGGRPGGGRFGPGGFLGLPDNPKEQPLAFRG